MNSYRLAVAIRVRGRLLASCIALATAVAVAEPAHAGVTWLSSDRFGSHAFGAFTVTNDVWGSRPCPQTIWADGASRWGVISGQSTPGAVESYPDVFETLGGALSSYTAIVGSVSETMPSTASANASYDIWLNGSRGYEVMVWTDTHHLSPPWNGRKLDITVYGVRYHVDVGIGAFGGGSTWVQQTVNTPVVTTHILAILDTLDKDGYIPASPVISEIDFGWEIASATLGAQVFTVHSYSLVIR